MQVHLFSVGIGQPAVVVSAISLSLPIPNLAVTNLFSQASNVKKTHGKQLKAVKNLLVPKRLPHKRARHRSQINHVIFVIVCVFSDSNPKPQVWHIPFPPLVNADYIRVCGLLYFVLYFCNFVLEIWVSKWFQMKMLPTTKF